MSYIMGVYQIIVTQDALTIKFADSDISKEEERRTKVFLFFIWGIFSFSLTAVPFFMKLYAHTIIFFLVLVIGGFVICINIIKRSEVKYFSVIVDKTGVHEVWNNPEQPFQKTILWDDLRYFNHLEEVFAVGSTRPSTPYDCIVFSAEDVEDEEVIKAVRKVMRKSMQYEKVFKEYEESIFIIVETQEGKRLFDEIKEYSKTYLK